MVTSGAAPPAIKAVIISWPGPTGGARLRSALRKYSDPARQFSMVVFRTQLYNAADMPNVVKIQDGYKVQPLSTYLHQPAPPAAPAIDFPKIDKELVKTDFFEYLDFALQFAPPGRRSRPSARSWPASASVPARPSTSKTSRPNTRRRCSSE